MIQPLETDSFIATQRSTYEEVGTVIGEDPHLLVYFDKSFSLMGKKVYFDSWLAKKYPVPGEVDKFVWFVKYEDIVAYEPIPEQSL